MLTVMFLRYKDLKKRGIVKSWPMLRRWIKLYNFPEGRKLGPNTRVWTEEELEAWLATRPTDKKPAPRRVESAS